MTKNKKKNIFIILLLIIVILPILLSFVKCDNGNSEMNQSAAIQEELINSKRLNKARAITGSVYPNTGLSPDLYYNNNLSSPEVVEILSDLEFHDFQGIGMYIVMYGNTNFINNNFIFQVVILNLENIYYIYLSQESESETQIPLFSNNEEEAGFEGWDNSEYNGKLFFNSLEIELTNYNEILDLPVGDQNDKLTELFSSTPFVETENKTGLQIIFEEIGSGFSGLANFFVGLFNSIVPVFWVNNQPTIITILVLAGVVLTIGFWGIDKLLKLFKIGLGGKK